MPFALAPDPAPRPLTIDEEEAYEREFCRCERWTRFTSVVEMVVGGLLIGGSVTVLHGILRLAFGWCVLFAILLPYAP